MSSLANSRVGNSVFSYKGTIQSYNFTLRLHCMKLTMQQTIGKLVPFVANLLILVNPGFKDVLTNRLTELGINEINTVKIPSQAKEYMIDN
ncbi:hypothetical protein KY289_017410 [Solanum tuberosum]|nr:hypothetical protein KY289_017410 [Solanum tuberosum]